MLQRKVTIKNPFRELAYYQSRVFVAFFIIIALMAGLLFWVANLQVFHYENYRTRSDANRIRVRPVAPTRGLIYDRNGVILAENRSVYSLELIPEQVDDIDETLGQLKELLQLDEDDPFAVLVVVSDTAVLERGHDTAVAHNRLSRGERVRAIATNGEWYQVRSSSGVQGFVHRTQVQVVALSALSEQQAG